MVAMERAGGTLAMAAPPSRTSICNMQQDVAWAALAHRRHTIEII